MVNYVDNNIANVTGLLKAKGMWEDTLMVLTADNGGYVMEVSECDDDSGHKTACFHGEAGANNYPLRG